MQRGESANHNNNRKLCILLPAHNEAATIYTLVLEIRKIELAETEITIVVVNDGSSDETFQEAQRAGAIVLSHERNKGVGAAFRTGLNWARQHNFDFFLHMDSDGQVNPKEIPDIAMPVITNEVDLCYASRFLRSSPDGLSAWKRKSLKLMSFVVSQLTGYRLSDISCGFRCMNADIMTVLRPSFDYDYIQQTLLQALAARPKVKEIPAAIRYDQETHKTAMSGKVVKYIWCFFTILLYSLGQFFWERFKQLLQTRVRTKPTTL